MGVLAHQHDHNVTFADCRLRLVLPLPVWISLIEGGTPDSVRRKLFGLVEEAVLQIIVLIKLETYEYV